MPTYSCDMGKEAVIMAIISFVLTIVNIMCILITATAVLKVSISCLILFYLNLCLRIRDGRLCFGYIPSVVGHNTSC